MRFSATIKASIGACFLGLFTVNGYAEKASPLAGTKPNIVILLIDDISFGALSHFGGKYQTPALDSLFEKGRVFKNFHVSPTCSPTRAAIMTGRHEFYAGVTHTILMRDQASLKTQLLPQMLKECGYATAMAGKWHLGDEKEYRPAQRGFDDVLQHGGGGIGQAYAHSSDFPGNHYNNPLLLHNEKMEQFAGYCTDIFFNHAMAWMKKQKKPFFLYLPTNVAHSPQEPPAGSEGPAKEAIMKNLDENVANLMAFLEKDNLDQNTLVIFLTDNGPADKQESEIYGLKGYKGNATEGGIRVPCAFYWKGKVQSGEASNDLCAAIDLFPTLAELAGYKGALPSQGKPWDGMSLLPLLEGQHLKTKRYVIGHKGRWTGAPESSQYKDASIQDEHYQLHFSATNQFALYDLQRDMGQTTDVKDTHPEITQALKKQFDAFWQDARPAMISENMANKIPVSRPFWDIYQAKTGIDPATVKDKSQTKESM